MKTKATLQLGITVYPTCDMFHFLKLSLCPKVKKKVCHTVYAVVYFIYFIFSQKCPLCHQIYKDSSTFLAWVTFTKTLDTICLKDGVALLKYDF